MTSRFPASLVWLALLSGALSMPALAGESLTLRVNDARGAPGDVVEIVVRTYSPRPLGQGQIRVRTTSSGTQRLAVASRGALAIELADTHTLPFAEFLGGTVFSQRGDAQAEYSFDGSAPMEQALTLLFSSASGTVNAVDGPLAVLRFRLRSDLQAGVVFPLDLDLGVTEVRGPDGQSIAVEGRGGELRIREPDDQPSAGVLRFDQRTYVASEGAGVALITLERAEGQAGEVSVTLQSSGGSATTPDDYSAVLETLVWPSGSSVLRTVRIPLINDRTHEDPETVRLLLSSPTGGARLDADRAEAVLTIVDDDAPASDPTTGRLGFSAGFFEGREDGPAVRVSVARDGEATTAATVRYETGDASALAGQDFVATSGDLSWSPGESGEKSLDIPLLDDHLDEGSEDFLVVLREASGAQIDPERSETVVTILDDDAPIAGCETSPTILCLQANRFRVEVVWRTLAGDSGRGQVIPLSDESGLVWFFSESNVEMLIKVLDGCSFQAAPAFWVFFAATTDVDFTVTVTDTFSGLVKQYKNPVGRAALPVQDTGTFASCP